MARVDPHNTELRWSIVISRRQYQVPWPNSLWHLDDYHSLIRWKMVIHGCMDGYSRRFSMFGSENNVIVEAVHLPHDNLLASFILETIDPSQQSHEMGVDIYTEALELMIQKLKNLKNKTTHT
ncbi:Hypothetical predicted protein, partial [Paramuricea clavata]